jgi:phage gp46-like protein
MPYISTVFNEEIQGLDIAIQNNTLLLGNDIPSLILTQLFSCNYTDNSGNIAWMGNSYGSFQVGSSFQTLMRSSTGGQFLLRARDLVINALQPLITNGIVQSITVPTPMWNNTNGTNAIIISVNVTLPKANSAVLYQYNFDLGTQTVTVA